MPNFENYCKLLKASFKKRTGLDLSEYYEDNQLQDFADNGWTVDEFVDWFILKYDIEDLSELTCYGRLI